MNETFLLWAQWGILDYAQYQIVKKWFGDLKVAWKKIDAPFLLQLGFGREKAERVLGFRERIDFEDLIRQMDTLGIQLFCVDDADYPSRLREIPNPPPFLFVRGSLPILHKALGVVGTRGITDYGRMATEKLVGDLARNGFTIVSGLALGVDAAAHEVALKNKAPTVAVLGCGVDVVYPVENGGLFVRILKSGNALVSEYPLGTPALKHHFPLRNRIVSGLSRGVLIVEGGVKSGALITARYALEQGREVFAVPNDITKRELGGTNHLIRRGEAKLVEKAQDILDEFGMENATLQLPLSYSTFESEILGLIANQGKSIDELTLETPYNVARLSEALIGLQLKGVAREIGGKWVLA
ncbi:DNA-protecting protein DprA [Candidatus Peregrinibacteria bacterium]|nr:DNA-protecting protein DprA [Candidatus Peregrinibacteria bacterium]